MMNDQVTNNVRVSIHLERCKFVSRKSDGNSGVRLNLLQHQALFAVQALLDATGYTGNLPGQELDGINPFYFSGVLPCMEFAHSEFLSAFGLERSLTGRGKREFKARQRSDAMGALYSLSEKHFTLSYIRKSPTDLEPVYINVSTPLMKLESVGKGKLTITPAPALIQDIDSYFLQKPADLYQSTKRAYEVFSSGRMPVATILFQEWLILKLFDKNRSKSKDIPLIRNTDTLIRELRMSHLPRLTALEQLEHALAISRRLGFIVSYTFFGGKTGKSIEMVPPSKKREIFAQNESIPKPVGVYT